MPTNRVYAGSVTGERERTTLLVGLMKHGHGVAPTTRPRQEHETERGLLGRQRRGLWYCGWDYRACILHNPRRGGGPEGSAGTRDASRPSAHLVILHQHSESERLGGGQDSRRSVGPVHLTKRTQ